SRDISPVNAGDVDQVGSIAIDFSVISRFQRVQGRGLDNTNGVARLQLTAIMTIQIPGDIPVSTQRGIIHFDVVGVDQVVLRSAAGLGFLVDVQATDGAAALEVQVLITVAGGFDLAHADHLPVVDRIGVQRYVGAAIAPGAAFVDDVAGGHRACGQF